MTTETKEKIATKAEQYRYATDHVKMCQLVGEYGYSLAETKLNAAMELLQKYEEWEALLLEDNDMWWPSAPKDRISGKSYDMMMELQTRRNQILEHCGYTFTE